MWPLLLTATMLSLLVAHPATAQQALKVPSGQPVTLMEVLIDDSQGKTWVRFRFIAPKIGNRAGEYSFETAGPDMDHLCAYLALPYLDEYALEPERVVISMSDRLVPFGRPDPEATQFFEAYRLENGACIWEVF